jgi:outer membrane protein
MKTFRAIAAVAFFAAISAVSISAQPKPAGPTTTAPAQSGPIPETKIALVDTDQFLADQGGIARLVAAAKRVENEFQPRRTELQTLQAQIEKATNDLQKAAPVQDAKVSAQQQDRIDQMKKDYQRKGEDAQAAYQKRLQDVLGPVYEEIGKAIDAYAKAHGLTLVLDIGSDHGIKGIVSAADSLDITKSFITEFNAKFPATAALTPPE